jgi:hypothetical protein
MGRLDDKIDELTVERNQLRREAIRIAKTRDSIKKGRIRQRIQEISTVLGALYSTSEADYERLNVETDPQP